MSVKTSQSGARVLRALELIAQYQPVGLSELARHLGSNIAAAQRAIATLADAGWIRATAGRPAAWELTAHIHAVAQHAYGSHDLRRRARGAMEDLLRQTGESVLLIVPDERKFVVIEVLESPHHVRSAPPVGLVVPARASASAWAMLPYMAPERQAEFLGEMPGEALRAKFAETLAQGYAVSRGDVFAGSTNIAAPVFEMDGSTIGAVLVSVPNDRADPGEEVRLGALVRAVAHSLSRGPAPLAPLAPAAS